MEIDIRKEVQAPIDRIRILDPNQDTYCVEYIKNLNNFVMLCDGSNEAEKNLEVYDKEHALNIIKALEKAIELGWLK